MLCALGIGLNDFNGMSTRFLLEGKRITFILPSYLHLSVVVSDEFSIICLVGWFEFMAYQPL